MNLSAGVIIENIRTGVKYRIVGYDMGFIACTKLTNNMNTDVFKYQLPYIAKNFKEVPQQ